MLNALLQSLLSSHAHRVQDHLLCVVSELVSCEAGQARLVSAGVVGAVQKLRNKEAHARTISFILLKISSNPLVAARCAVCVLLIGVLSDAKRERS